jgi:hypothetical protein
LLEKNKISQAEFEELNLQLQETRAKLGVIAVTEKLLTAKQAEEINELQKKSDRRFGDIAIEKGYLLKEEVTYLLNLQGNSYTKLVQLLTVKYMKTMRDIEAFLKVYKKEYNLTDYDIDALKSDNLDRVIPVFIDINAPFLGECVSLLIRNIVRFIYRDIIIKKSYITKKYNCPALVYQKLTGAERIFIGLAGKKTVLASIAGLFKHEQFSMLTEGAIHSLCDFIGCSNSLYTTNLGYDNVQISMSSPEYCFGKTLSLATGLFVVPILIHGEQADIIITSGDPVVAD